MKFFLVGTKADKPRAVSREEGEALARRRGCVGFSEVSAKADRDRDGVRAVFASLVESIVADDAFWRARDGRLSPGGNGRVVLGGRGAGGEEEEEEEGDGLGRAGCAC